MHRTTIAMLTATVIAFVLASSLEAGVTQWRKVPDLCRQLRAEGWKPAPDGAGDPKTGEMRYEGRALKRRR